MRSLLDNDELRDAIREAEFPIPNILVEYQSELEEPKTFPVIAIKELTNTDRHSVTTADGKLKPGPTSLSYQFAVFCRDCRDRDGNLLTRGDACRKLGMALNDWLFEHYNMQRSSFGPTTVFDKTSNVLFLRMQCVLDEYGYTYAK